MALSPKLSIPRKPSVSGQFIGPAFVGFTCLTLPALGPKTASASSHPARNPLPTFVLAFEQKGIGKARESRRFTVCCSGYYARQFHLDPVVLRHHVGSSGYCFFEARKKYAIHLSHRSYSLRCLMVAPPSFHWAARVVADLIYEIGHAAPNE